MGRLITAVRCKVNASNHEVITHALKLFNICPCCYAVYPEMTPHAIRMSIIHAEIRD